VNLSTLIAIARRYAALDSLDRRAVDDSLDGRPRVVSPRGLEVTGAFLEAVELELEGTDDEELLVELDSVLDVVEGERLARTAQDGRGGDGGPRL
jgi:hypothetical protein